MKCILATCLVVGRTKQRKLNEFKKSEGMRNTILVQIGEMDTGNGAAEWDYFAILFFAIS